MNTRSRYDDTLDDGMGMDALLGRQLKNYADRYSPPHSTRAEILVRVKDQELNRPILRATGAYLRAIGRILIVIISLSWLDTQGQLIQGSWIEDHVFEDYALTQWFYRRSTMNPFCFGSGNFLLSG